VGSTLAVDYFGSIVPAVTAFGTIVGSAGCKTVNSGFAFAISLFAAFSRGTACKVDSIEGNKGVFDDIGFAI
jgi:hypothetical protein